MHSDRNEWTTVEKEQQLVEIVQLVFDSRYYLISIYCMCACACTRREFKSHLGDQLSVCLLLCYCFICRGLTL